MDREILKLYKVVPSLTNEKDINLIAKQRQKNPERHERWSISEFMDK